MPPDTRSELEKEFDGLWPTATLQDDKWKLLIHRLKRERDDARESLKLMSDGLRKCPECGEVVTCVKCQQANLDSSG